VPASLPSQTCVLVLGPNLLIDPRALPERRWRLYLRPAEAQGDLVAEASAMLQRYLPAARFSVVENPSRFHCDSRVASAFRAGPVFVAGDGAHVCSPAEGLGMN
jgi:2-polyprenyl-6-methoxyphenol hydroxylase-like FAD-dependent oxidoreductase